MKDTIFTYGGDRYYADENGVIAKSKWVEKGGNKFYAGPDGAFMHNQFISFGNSYYYLNTSGAVMKTPFVMNGYTVTPNPQTGVISKKDYDYSQSGYVYRGYTTYVLVNISKQSMMYVRDGRLILETPVITGMKNKYDTPKGTYSVQYKARNVNLKGQVDDDEWDVTVSYWVAFIGGSYGFHDAGWKSNFGGQTYTWNGSHGCVNMPVSAAAKFYSEVAVGTRVFII
ncbi:MAG: L,D-transpeptidase family protein [Firmicutes bacterium]|nr:L,D-transpeptidase family protein [Bacillota bacterium]